MKQHGFIILGIYDLCLAFAAILCGALMINSNYGIFSSYPSEWLSVLPFKSWFLPGIITIVIFGAGNIIASLCSFRQRGSRSWFVSALMGGILLISLIMQTVIIKEYYLATFEFLIACILQLVLSGYVLLKL